MSRKKWLWLLLPALVLAAIFIFGSGDEVPVRAAEARRALLEVTVTATSTGTVRSDNVLKLTSERLGRIVKLNVIEGSTVAPGEVLLELDPREVRINLDLAEATYERAGAMHEELMASIKALAEETAAAIQRAKAAHKEAFANHQRHRELYEKGFVSLVELDAARARLEIAGADLNAAEAGRLMLDARKIEVKARAAALKEAGSSLALARLNYERSFIKTSRGGIVTNLPVELGETVLIGSLLAQVVETASLYIESFIDEADIDKVSTGLDVDVTMDAYPSKTFRGKVDIISPVVLGTRNETRTFEVRVLLLQKEVPLKLGMSADVEIIVQRATGVLVVPSQAVIERGGKKYVYLVEGDRAVFQEVETGLSNWTLTEITKGVDEGRRVVVNPDVKGLEDGARVAVAD